MPRGPRLDAPGVLHHVMARGLDRQSILRDNHDRDDFVRRLAKVAGICWVTSEALVGGGRGRDVCRARDGLAYLWVEVLGRSGRHLAREVGIRPESVYQGARRGQSQRARWGQVMG